MAKNDSGITMAEIVGQVDSFADTLAKLCEDGHTLDEGLDLARLEVLVMNMRDYSKGLVRRVLSASTIKA